MTRLEQLTMSWGDYRLLSYIDCVEVTKDQLETIIDDWLILDEGQFDVYPDAHTLYVRKFHLNSIHHFSTSKKIEHDRLIFVCELPDGHYRYRVKEEVIKMNIAGICPYETPCGWCSKWDKKCNEAIGPAPKKAPCRDCLNFALTAMPNCNKCNRENNYEYFIRLESTK